MWSFNQFSENVVFRIKLDYFKQCLMKDADYFDKNNPLELTAKINKETAAMQNGMGNKVGAVLLACFSLIFGFGFAFWWGWLYTLILLASFPALAIAGVAMSVAMESGTGDSMRAYSQSSGYAEQALHSIKVVYTYGMEEVEAINYAKYLYKTKEIGFRTGVKAAIGSAMMFLMMNGVYSYGFYMGGWVIERDIKLKLEGGETSGYSGGTILACMFSVMFGAFYFGGAGPHIKAVSEGKVAGKLCFDVIDAIPKVNIKSTENGKKISDFTGGFEMKNVNFTYPTRKELKVLKNINCVFEAGKTTALVGPSGSGKSSVIQLFERFYDPCDGEILMDGVNLKELDLSWYRQNVGYVGQEPVLFNTTIKENMKMAKPDATD